jgi:hypothetical protein
MLPAPQLDPLGSLLVEIREDVDVDALVDGRVRGFEPAPGDAKPNGSYQGFIVIVALGVPPDPQLPVTFATYGIRCYGATPQAAWAVWGAVVKCVHENPVRVKSNGLGIYKTIVVDGGEQGKDPDTQQPVVTGTVRLIATTQAVA